MSDEIYKEEVNGPILALASRLCVEVCPDPEAPTPDVEKDILRMCMERLITLVCEEVGAGYKEPGPMLQAIYKGVETRISTLTPDPSKQ